jgi:hypothetical protein
MSTSHRTSYRPLLVPLFTAAFGLVLAGCGDEAVPVADADEALARQIAAGIVAACPAAALDDQDARDACADGLTELEVLRDAMNEPFFWGAQGADAGYEFALSGKTHFNPLVWRRMYLSTYAFPGDYSIEKAGDLTVIHLAPLFRGDMDIGAYPYPFWHSKDKWDSYLRSTELLFFIREGKLIGALRSFEKDEAKPVFAHEWDGKWQWSGVEGAEPHVSLYTYLFKPENPHVARLDDAYRALEEELRGETCLACHSPDNASKMNPLELFNYPNQALTARRDIISQLEHNFMPPGTDTTPPGMADDAARQRLITLAGAFTEVANQALAYEGEPSAAP